MRKKLLDQSVKSIPSKRDLFSTYDIFPYDNEEINSNQEMIFTFDLIFPIRDHRYEMAHLFYFIFNHGCFAFI